MIRSETILGLPRYQLTGIDEHFFTRRQGYVTTLCDLKNHTIYDVVLGRSDAALEDYFERLEGKDKVRLVCMDLSSTYRALVRKHFPNARIVADRFHVIRLVHHHFLACGREPPPAEASIVAGAASCAATATISPPNSRRGCGPTWPSIQPWS